MTPTATVALPPPTTSATRSTVLREVATYLALVSVMVVGLALALPHAGIVVLLTMPTPLVALVLITFLLTSRGRRRELWTGFRLRRLGWRSWPAALVLTALVILVVPYGVAVLLGHAALAPLSTSPTSWLLGSLDVLTALGLVTLLAMTEEIGWRGYLLPRMQVLVPRRTAALLVGFVHGLFHLPLILLTTTYNSVGNRWVVASSFMVLLTAAGVVYAWLVERSGSVWPAAFAHSSVNVLLEGAGLVVVVSPLALAYTAGESGVVTMAGVTVLAVVLLVHGRCWDPSAPPVLTGPVRGS